MPIFQRPRAIVIGGSLGGLLSAICLRAIGWDVEVFERSPRDLDSRGGGLVLQPDVTDALDFSGVSYGPNFGVPSRDRIFVAQDGSVRRMYMPQVQIAWNGLYLRMREALGPLVQSGETFVSFTQDPSFESPRVTAYFASGRSVQADLLIGADGPLSSVRAQLLPTDTPSYAGYVAWRGILAEAALSDDSRKLLDDAFAFQDGPGHQFLSYRIPGDDGSVRPGQRRQNWVWYRRIAQGPALEALLQDRDGHRHTHSLPPGALREAEMQALHRDARDELAPALASLVTATPDPFVQLIHDYEAPRMVFGRVALVGDAAFVARPHTGAGAGKAAANALALARALQNVMHDVEDIDSALASWELGQLPADRRLVRWGIALGRRIMEVAQPA
ncbi:FAD binding domain-containing protein [Cupriavidus pampae]|uniref:2,6-dihydroxypyridine 3-monooxygenase n=1 Tax=Cupriavidus pampae TaxID=659251 RepID=A0ABN7ZI13_9BURK|nr:FAD-dependent monooxygenase [Cupriavidus pampae]CAG9185389.1 2,6-dihydroxypyridine 3-monooxygenase [Cupriavidus pampae]